MTVEYSHFMINSDIQRLNYVPMNSVVETENQKCIYFRVTHNYILLVCPVYFKLLYANLIFKDYV